MTRCVALATRVSDPVLRASVCLVAVAHTTSHPVLAIDRNTRCFRVLYVGLARYTECRHWWPRRDYCSARERRTRCWVASW